MKKSTFFKSTLILIVGGFITKLLGMIIRIITSRYLGSEGMGIYSLLLPTFSLLVALSSLGFPMAISKLVAEDKYNNKNILFSIVPISLFINLSIIIIMFFVSKFISINLLHDERTYYGLICTSFVLPFIGISSILRGYFFGKERMFPHVLSNVLEDVIRLIVLVIFIPYFLDKGLEYAVAFVIISNIASEIISIITFLLFLSKHINIKKSDIIPSKKSIKNVFNISLPNTGSRIIGNIGYFFEPVIFSSIMFKLGYSSEFIVNEYGIFTGFVLPLLLLPSFFTTAISQALIPVISKCYSKCDYKEARRKLKQAIMFSLLIGIPCAFIFELFPGFILKFLYNTSDGILYTRILAPILLIQYVQSLFSCTLNAIGKSKSALLSTILGVFVKNISLIIFTFLFNVWGLVISLTLNIIIVTLHQYNNVKMYLKK